MRRVIFSICVLLALVFVGMVFTSIKSCRRYNGTNEESTVVRIEAIAEKGRRVGDPKQGTIRSYRKDESERRKTDYVIRNYP